MTTVVLVHPGSVFTSARSQIDPARFDACVAGMREVIGDCEGLVVIDGSLSDGIPGEFDAEIAARLACLAGEGRPAFRLWGCDSGELPYPGWQPFGDLQPVHDGQEAAARAVAPLLREEAQVLCTGAWATRDDSGGCVNSVRDIIASIVSSKIHEVAGSFITIRPVSIDGSAVFEEYLDMDVGDPEP